MSTAQAEQQHWHDLTDLGWFHTFLSMFRCYLAILCHFPSILSSQISCSSIIQFLGHFPSIQKCPLVAGLEGDWRFHLGKEGLLCDTAKQQKQPSHFVAQWLSLLSSMPLLWHRGSTFHRIVCCLRFFLARICHETKVMYHVFSFASRTFCRTMFPYWGSEEGHPFFSTTGSKFHFYCHIQVAIPHYYNIYRLNPIANRLFFFRVTMFVGASNHRPRCLKIPWVWRVRHLSLLVEVKFLVLDLYLGFRWKWSHPESSLLVRKNDGEFFFFGKNWVAESLVKFDHYYLYMFFKLRIILPQWNWEYDLGMAGGGGDKRL